MGAARSIEWRLARHRRIAIADRLANLARDVEPTPFAIEAPARAGIRASLCLQGWPWHASDAEATILTLRSLQIVGAKRPTWEQGQPEYTQATVIAMHRETCVHCGKTLPDGHYKFCSKHCFKAHRLIIANRQNREETNVKSRAWRAAWAEKQQPRKCGTCERDFQPKRPAAKFCSNHCALTAARSSRRTVPMVCDPI
jgi:hypothetical protein